MGSGLFCALSASIKKAGQIFCFPSCIPDNLLYNRNSGLYSTALFLERKIPHAHTGTSAGRARLWALLYQIRQAGLLHSGAGPGEQVSSGRLCRGAGRQHHGVRRLARAVHHPEHLQAGLADSGHQRQGRGLPLPRQGGGGADRRPVQLDHQAGDQNETLQPLHQRGGDHSGRLHRRGKRRREVRALSYLHPQAVRQRGDRLKRGGLPLGEGDRRPQPGAGVLPEGQRHSGGQRGGVSGLLFPDVLGECDGGGHRADERGAGKPRRLPGLGRAADPAGERQGHPRADADLRDV